MANAKSSFALSGRLPKFPAGPTTGPRPAVEESRHDPVRTGQALDMRADDLGQNLRTVDIDAARGRAGTAADECQDKEAPVPHGV